MQGGGYRFEPGTLHFERRRVLDGATGALRGPGPQAPLLSDAPESDAGVSYGVDPLSTRTAGPSTSRTIPTFPGTAAPNPNQHGQFPLDGGGIECRIAGIDSGEQLGEGLRAK